MPQQFNFRITDGPYQGDYRISERDISASAVGDLIAAGGPDLDAAFASKAIGIRAIAGLVWMVRREGNRGLAYRAVADRVNMDNFEGLPAETGDEVVSTPTTSGAAGDNAD